jgi:ankyrin repeat protein
MRPNHHAQPPLSPEHRALSKAATVGDLEQCRQAVADGADPQAPGLLGRSALSLAAAAGRAECCQWLASLQPPRHLLCEGGLSPLAWAARNGWAPCVEALIPLSHPWDFDPPQMKERDIPWTPLGAAIQAGSLDCFELLLPRSSLAAQPGRHSPLFMAAEKDNLAMARQLLQAGADARLDGAGSIALFAAIDVQSIEMLSLLLPLSPNRCSDARGRRPLETAARAGWEEGAILLAQSLPRDAAPTHFKRAALEASYGGHAELAKSLAAMQASRSQRRALIGSTRHVPASPSRSANRL